MNISDEELARRRALLHERLKLVPPDRQRANLFSILWREAEDDCQKLVGNVRELRGAIEPFLAIDPETMTPTMRNMLLRLRRAYDASDVSDWDRE